MTLGLTVMFALNEESLANHIGERKSRLGEDETKQLEKEKAELLEQEAMMQNEADEEIAVVQLGQVAYKKP